jgi:DNA-binding response OmpR family regulator
VLDVDLVQLRGLLVNAFPGQTILESLLARSEGDGFTLFDLRLKIANNGRGPRLNVAAGGATAAQPRPPTRVVVSRTHRIEHDVAAGIVYCAAQDLKLTRQEYDLFAFLAARQGQLLTPDYCLREVWGPQWQGNYQALYSALHRLKKKLGPGPSRMILNDRGLAYQFLPERV